MAASALLAPLRSRPWLALLALVWLIGLAGTAWWLHHQATAMGRPALWQISKGSRTAYLFGTIHAVPANARWLSPRIEDAVSKSDVLVLEVADLARERADRHSFERLAHTPGLPPVAQRIAPADRPRLEALARKAPGRWPGSMAMRAGRPPCWSARLRAAISAFPTRMPARRCSSGCSPAVTSP